jgi:hypothetical protein
MDVLHLTIEQATSAGLLTTLAANGMRNRTSMYVDDMVTFIRPRKIDLDTCAAVVHDFGVASGLQMFYSPHSLSSQASGAHSSHLGLRDSSVALKVPWPTSWLAEGYRGAASVSGG